MKLARDIKMEPLPQRFHFYLPAARFFALAFEN